MTRASIPVRVLVVDNDRRVRQSIAGLIGISEGLECVGIAADPATTMAILERDPVDVLLIDPRLPEAEIGLALLTELHARWPDIAIVAMSCVDGVERSARGSGALAFVSKSAQPELLVETVRTCGRAARDEASLTGSDGMRAQTDG